MNMTDIREIQTLAAKRNYFTAADMIILCDAVAELQSLQTGHAALVHQFGSEEASYRKQLETQNATIRLIQGMASYKVAAELRDKFLKTDEKLEQARKECEVYNKRIEEVEQLKEQRDRIQREDEKAIKKLTAERDDYWQRLGTRV